MCGARIPASSWVTRTVVRHCTRSTTGSTGLVVETQAGHASIKPILTTIYVALPWNHSTRVVGRALTGIQVLEHSHAAAVGCDDEVLYRISRNILAGRRCVRSECENEIGGKTLNAESPPVDLDENLLTEHLLVVVPLFDL